MKGMILAAGFGTRLRPVTYTLPKPMVPLCNRPLIAWAVESYLSVGVRAIIINLHHLPEIIERYLRVAYDGRADFRFSVEAHEILGTGGGVRRVRPLLDEETEFFLVNGDTVQFPDWNALRRARHKHTALAALTLRHPPEGDRFTAVWYEDGRITGFGSGHGEPLMFSGSHIISHRIFDALPERDVSGIVEHAYQPALERGDSIAGVIDDGLWFDIGTPQRYMAASHALLEATVRGDLEVARDSSIRGDSIVHDSAAGNATRSTIGARSRVEGTVTDSVVWDDCAIGPDVRLERCIVAHGVELQGDLELRDALVCRDDSAIPDDYHRRDGLVIVSL